MSNSGVFDMRALSREEELDRQLAELIRPIAKVRQLTPEDVCKLRAKEAFRAELKACGLSGRAAAKLLKVTEGCVRAWLSPEDLKRNPPQWATEALGKEALIRHAQHTVDVLKVGGIR